MENGKDLKEIEGYTLKTAKPCDQCENESENCKKLILAGSEHICAVPSKDE